jgi:hypothetical protein
MKGHSRGAFSRTSYAVVFALAFGSGFGAVAACSAPADEGSADTSEGVSASKSALCVLCVTDDDCAGRGVCAQFGSDSFCAPACTNGEACSAAATCSPVNTIEGQQTSVCVPRGDLCGPSVDQSAQDPMSGDSVAMDNAPVDGQVGAAGGTLSRLYFAVVGDTRPPMVNDTKGYPTAIITKIYGELQAASPRPAFAVSTGDYQFSTGSGTQAAPQLDLYLQARSQFTGPLYPAMGNHECTGATASNCGSGTTNGVTNNYKAFLSKLLTPIGQTSPNYVINVNGTGNAWTSKFVFVAGNAWTSADAAWLDTQLAKPTTYTFIIRHEPSSATTAPGVKPSEQIMAKHPYTLAIVGHTHTYGHTGKKQITIGNGGAPLTGSVNYGYGLIQQRTDGAIQMDVIDYATGKPDLKFRAAVKPDGTPTK